MDQQLKEQQEENISSDVRSFCALIARIVLRCLREKNPQVMQLLSLSSQTEEAERGDTHDAA